LLKEEEMRIIGTKAFDRLKKLSEDFLLDYPENPMDIGRLPEGKSFRLMKEDPLNNSEILHELRGIATHRNMRFEDMLKQMEYEEKVDLSDAHAIWHWIRKHFRDPR